MSAIVTASQASSAPSWLGDRAAARAKPAQGAKSGELSAEALALIGKLKARDTEVRQHEQAHLAAAGGLAVSGASYTYQRGPDGINYAVGGEVQIDTSPGRTPEETIARARAVAAAALAPADPSGPDRAVAAQAQQMVQQALAQQAQQRAAEAAPSQGRDGQAAAQAGGEQQPDPLTELVRRAYGVSEPSWPTIDISA